MIEILAGKLLPSLGYKTLVAYDGASALKIAKLRQPDLMLLDFQLSDMTGLQVLRQLSSEGVNIRPSWSRLTGRSKLP